MKRFLLVFFLLFGINLQAQEEEKTRVYFSDALFMHLPKYEQKAKIAYKLRQYKKADQLFESLVLNLTGSYMNNFWFRNLKRQEVSLHEFKKPVYLLTYASWCIPGKGEIPALNELAEKYRKNIDFVVLFWDRRKTVKKLAKNFNPHVKVLYIDETRNNDDYVVKQLKHSLGLPTCFLLDADKKLNHIQRHIFGPYHTSKEDSFTLHYEKIKSGIEDHLMNQQEEDGITELVLGKE